MVGHLPWDVKRVGIRTCLSTHFFVMLGINLTLSIMKLLVQCQHEHLLKTLTIGETRRNHGAYESPAKTRPFSGYIVTPIPKTRKIKQKLWLTIWSVAAPGTAPPRDSTTDTPRPAPNPAIQCRRFHHGMPWHHPNLCGVLVKILRHHQRQKRCGHSSRPKRQTSAASWEMITANHIDKVNDG